MSACASIVDVRAASFVVASVKLNLWQNDRAAADRATGFQRFDADTSAHPTASRNAVATVAPLLVVAQPVG